MKEKIAIIGMGCVFPGALDFTEYWQNIVEGKDCIKEVDPDFWKLEEFYDPDPSVPDKSYCKMGGQSGPVEFDTKEFGISPKVMEHTAVDQLFGLIVARQALIDAGYYGKNARPFNRENTGVIMSAGTASHVFSLHVRTQRYKIRQILVNNGVPEAAADMIVAKFLETQHEWSEDDNPGYIPNVVAGRIANRFDLGGTSCSVDAACGASLGAVKFAVDELQNHNMDMMLVGGANLDNSPVTYLSFTKTPACSKTGKIRPFDAKADGMIIGDGVGIMVLKRLSDAERDGDKIYAVICGTGSSSDGRAKSIYAPSKEGQMRALRRAYANSGVEMDTIGLLEAHGTGTAAGDACEAGSAAATFPKSDKRKTVIGSVKSQIGHMRLAAGVAGCMKVALALHHKVLPNSINMETPNPALVDSRLTVLKKSQPWIVNDAQPVRRAGASAFGFGGTNFHVVLEEYKPEHESAYRVGRAPTGVLLAADSKAALIEKLQALAAAPEQFRDEAYRYENAGSGQFRLSFVVKTKEDVADKCATALELLSKTDAASFTQKGIAYNSKAVEGKLTVLFPGQGTQAVNMLSEAAINYPELRTAVSKADNVMLKRGADPISEILYPKALMPEEFAAAEAVMNNTANTQPVLAAVEAGLYNIMTKRGLKADSFIGHSFGELVALWADGVMDYETLITMAKERGSLMSEADPNAAMMACMTDKATLTEACKGIENVYVANENSAAQTVVSGSVEGITALEEKLTGMGIRAVRLKVSGAFHSPYMKEASVHFRTYLDGLKLNKPTGAVIANATGKSYTKNVADLLEKQLLNPVLFRTSAEKAYEDGSRIFVEVGNGKVLTNLLKDCLAGKDYIGISLCPEKGKDTAEALEFAMAQLAVLGVGIQDDPYRFPYDEDYVPKKSKTTYTLQMKSFVLPKHKEAMDAALLPDQRIIDIMKTAQEPKTIIKEVEVIKEVEKPVEVKTAAPAANAYSANAEVFTKFMDVQTSQMQAASDMLSKAGAESEKNNVLNCVTMFQNNSMRALEAYFGNQTGTPVTVSAPVAISAPVVTPVAAPAPAPVVAAAPVVTATPAPVVEAPVAAPVVEAPKVEAPVAASNVDVYAILTEAIADKTGYPTDMIDEDMELEADLGIDSIKRVEILSTVNTNLGGVFTKENVEELSGLGKIADIVAYLKDLAPAAALVEVAPVEQEASVAAPASNVDMYAILTEAIADKTGYPTDMIDEDMELEADLGIDSIKRVEILSSVNTALGGVFTKENVEELSGLGKIADIVTYLKGLSSAAVAVEAAPVVEVPVVVEAAPAAAAPAVAGGKITEVILAAIADKTGYPEDMIDNDMELEADLGIDSIKRVEIFADVIRQLGINLTAEQTEELSGLSTVEAIQNYLSALV